MIDQRWLQVFEHLSAAFPGIEGLCGGASDGFGNSALLECRNDWGHLIRRWNNLALLHGFPPAAVERAGGIHDSRDNVDSVGAGLNNR